MKSKIFFVFIMSVVLLCADTARAYNEDVLAGMWNKLIRGAANVLTGWLEIPAQTIKGYKAEGGEVSSNILGAAGGFFEGIGCAIGRTLWGVVETAGFWTANPEDNADTGMHLDAEFVWQEGSMDSYNILYGEEQDLGPIGRKFLRGLGNTVFGWAEFPGQIAKGVENRSMDLGIVKGIWFACSREIYGLADLVTAIFPTPEDNPGYPFDREYAWGALVDVIEE